MAEAGTSAAQAIAAELQQGRQAIQAAAVAEAGASYMEQRLQKGQAGSSGAVEQAGCSQCRACNGLGQVSSSWIVSALPRLPRLVTLPLSMLTQQQRNQ